ncbi:hypothetical protein BJ684DRAFT_16608 [Piptocephalis cylindrospora]|uniref:Uncharacterized protein n=1 Tax=Piptocephalis cylindrospora TaxID=1907219 RepID=A0A4P9Y2X0_9FUNG|nr:hypothetical protein BJ684DRAFT_16608 [Piptocephalis cylindrospora]|eukprot:RKP12952.1 hypothetical protein BJ684DRAFT_16608 [Piptocephalis cylindrospora]
MEDIRHVSHSPKPTRPKKSQLFSKHSASHASDLTPTASYIPDHNREWIREELMMDHAVDNTRFNAPTDMIRPPIGMTDSLFGGRDQAGPSSCPPSPRGETKCISKSSYPRMPPPGPGSSAFVTSHHDGGSEYYGSRSATPVHPISGHASPRSGARTPVSRANSLTPDAWHRAPPPAGSNGSSTPRSTSGRVTPQSRYGYVPSHTPPPGLVSLDDSRWRRDVIPDHLSRTPSGVSYLQQEEMQRRAMHDPLHHPGPNDSRIGGRSTTFHHFPTQGHRTAPVSPSSTDSGSKSLNRRHSTYAFHDDLPPVPQRKARGNRGSHDEDDHHHVAFTASPQAHESEDSSRSSSSHEKIKKSSSGIRRKVASFFSKTPSPRSTPVI